MGQAAYWLQFIEEYDFDIVHRPGTSYRSCDALSRRPQEDSESQKVLCRIAKLQEENADVDVELTPDVVALEQKKNKTLRPLMDALSGSGQRSLWSDFQSEAEETRALWAQRDSLRFQNGMLQRQFSSVDGHITRMQIIMPRCFKKVFLHCPHASDGNIGTAHIGVKKTKTLAHVEQRAYWVG